MRHPKASHKLSGSLFRASVYIMLNASPTIHVQSSNEFAVFGFRREQWGNCNESLPEALREYNHVQYHPA
ncbi:uncharacterized protein PHALS_00828 [Plasmopara halstedii]|uniref:Uncharacterized protein n=1 Tax=Plasmopara halstedii TaxID=4781 RepID=A0A0P1AUB1_PLAHL|nr:uncharacterized protein PHALS_00828 [Plasmopara halstedii]CEG44464.1 hypothetical protein PHALS_00828 [Plasmopara halstedii]|eukprot:XP_024580833.1 hypothetical protein PHALS_00828 [Plasmopara halstedii]